MAAPNLTATLNRVRMILEETCDADGQGHNLQERQRRKAYRIGINRALAELQSVKVPADRVKS